jgi:hypothetical protein
MEEIVNATNADVFIANNTPMYHRGQGARRRARREARYSVAFLRKNLNNPL